MAVISFSKNSNNKWVVAGWAYRQLLEDALSQSSADPEMAKTFTLAIETGGLSLELVDPLLAGRITHAIKHVVTGILSGKIRSGIHEKSFGNDYTVKQYIAGLQELAAAIPTT